MMRWYMFAQMTSLTRFNHLGVNILRAYLMQILAIEERKPVFELQNAMITRVAC